MWDIIKKVFLYILPLVVSFIGLCFMIENNTLVFFITSIISFSIYTFIIFKNYKFLSPLSSVSFLIMSFIILGIGGLGSDVESGALGNSASEKVFMLNLALILFFYLIVGFIWIRKDRVWIKALSVVFIGITSFFVVAFGSTVPAFYQNFVYTRIYILMYFFLSIFLIMNKKIFARVLGIIGIFVSIGCLLFSTVLLTAKVYTLENEDKKEVLDFIDPIAKEMIQDYNDSSLTQEAFCKYCGPTLLNTLYGAEPLLPIIREEYNECTFIGEPTIFRSFGKFYIEYPVKFSSFENNQFVIFVLEGITTESNVFGFYISEIQGDF